MFKVESNLNDVFQNTAKKLEETIQFDKIIREAAFDGVALISRRVQNEGEKTDGSKITSPSSKKIGAYSYGYGNKRKKRGRQVDHIDMTFSGDMMGDLVPIPEGENSYIIGFRGKLSSDKAEWNELKFGKIFQLSESEIKLIGKTVEDKVHAIIGKSS